MDREIEGYHDASNPFDSCWLVQSGEQQQTDDYPHYAFSFNVASPGVRVFSFIAWSVLGSVTDSADSDGVARDEWEYMKLWSYPTGDTTDETLIANETINLEVVGNSSDTGGG
jgi:hypothetical protein